VTPMENRILHATEVRASKADGKMLVKGYAARYGVLSQLIPPGFRERIAPGAFKRILAANPDCVMLFQHDQNVVLGRTTAGTLRLREDSKGLAFECDLPNTQAGRDAYESIKRQDISGCSFAFNLAPGMDSLQEEEVEDDSIRGAVKRTIRQVVRTIRDFANLFDCSIVTNPAYPGTSVDARNLAATAEMRSRIDAVRQPVRSPAGRQALVRRCHVREQRQPRENRSIVSRRRNLFEQV
jgi:HK97 family phage prohead protease